MAIAQKLLTEPDRGVFDFTTLPKYPSVLSAGGVAVRGEGRSREVLLVGSGVSDAWRIPKGMLAPGETIASAACREVQEETGVAVCIERLVDRAEWIYGYGGRTWQERCFFHRLTATTDSSPCPDAEHAVAAWVPAESALIGMQYEAERRALALALR